MSLDLALGKSLLCEVVVAPLHGFHHVCRKVIKLHNQPLDGVACGPSNRWDIECALSCSHLLVDDLPRRGGSIFDVKQVHPVAKVGDPTTPVADAVGPTWRPKKAEDWKLVVDLGLKGLSTIDRLVTDEAADVRVGAVGALVSIGEATEGARPDAMGRLIRLATGEKGNGGVRGAIAGIIG